MHSKVKFIKVPVAILLIVILFGVIIGHLSLKRNSPTFIKKNLLIEGWLPSYALEASLNNIGFNNYKNIFVLGIAGNHDTIYITELRNRLNKKEKINDPIKLLGNGAIYFSNASIQKISSKNSYTKISIYARGDSSYYRYAHFFCAIGDSVIGQSFTSRKTTKLKVSGNFTLERLQFFNLYFGNDLAYDTKDRNLVIDSIVLDNTKLNKMSDFLILLDKKLPEGIVNFPFKSNAEFTSAYLKALGLERDMVVLDTFFNHTNKTAAVARLFNNISRNLKIDRDTFNTLSYNFHSLRSYLTFKKMMPNATVGTVCLPDLKRKNESWLVKEWRNIAVILDEEISIAGTLLFYY